jgi:hypothetical protein
VPRTVAPVIAAIVAAFVVAAVAAIGGFSDATLAGVAGFVGGVVAVTGTTYALSGERAFRGSPGSGSVVGLQAGDDVEPNESTVPAEQREGVPVPSSGVELEAGGNGHTSDVSPAAPPVVRAAEGARGVRGLRVEGAEEPVGPVRVRPAH